MSSDQPLRISHYHQLRIFAPVLAQKYAEGRKQAFVEEMDGASTRQPGTHGIIEGRDAAALAGHRFFAQPAAQDIDACLAAAADAAKMNPNTHAYVIVPKWTDAPWWTSVKANFAIARTLPKGGVYYERWIARRKVWVTDSECPHALLILRTTSP